MQAGIMQPYFLPYMGYFQLIHSVDTFLLYGHVSFRKKSWITRNQLKDKSQAYTHYFGVPVKKQSSNKLIKSLAIDYSTPWQKTGLSRIASNYRGAKFFDETYPLVQKILTDSSVRLVDLNAYSLRLIAEHLNIDTPIVVAEGICFDEIEEALVSEDLGELNTKSARVISLCKHLDCDTYVNPQSGSTLYDKALFLSKGVQLNFIKSQQYEYSQFTKPFTPNLSIIDALMHTGKAACQQQLSAFSIV